MPRHLPLKRRAFRERLQTKLYDVLGPSTSFLVMRYAGLRIAVLDLSLELGLPVVLGSELFGGCD